MRSLYRETALTAEPCCTLFVWIILRKFNFSKRHHCAPRGHCVYRHSALTIKARRDLHNRIANNRIDRQPATAIESDSCDRNDSSVYAQTCRGIKCGLYSLECKA